MEHSARAHVGLALFRDNPNAAGVILTKFYEYLHYGLPILCSDFPLWRRFVERHDCGAVVPPGDAEAAFDVLARWAADPARYRTLSANARAAASRYRWAPMGERLAELYRNLLAP
jgi:glycosyltransferase involved in cell wall biosynthesis